MTIPVLLFARAKDLVGSERIAVSLPDGATVGALRAHLAAEHPKLKGLIERSAFAVNDEFADDATFLAPDAEIALLPPVSGG
jgi:molybdopterin converting factor subunit 1